MDNSIKDLGNGLKGINFDAWGGIENFLRETSTGAGGTAKPQLLRRVNPWLAKATDMTANAVASLPFDLLTENGDVFDESSEWRNRLGGIPNPKSLFYKLASSLCLGRAYIIPTYTSRMIVDLHYCAPHTVVPLITTNGLQQFSRTSDWGQSGTYSPSGMDEITRDDGEMMYFWLPDSDVEIGPAKSYPASSALLPAELITAMDSTLQVNSERGFIPPTILAIKGMVGQGEREKAEAWWNSFVRRWTSTVAKIVNGEAVDVKQVGAGMAELKTIYRELKKQAIEDVAASYGIPAAIFMSDMAFATEVNPLIKVWYSTSIFMKIYRAIEDTFNDQILYRYGLTLKFNPDALDAFQQDEQVRATAYSSYTNAGMRPSVAAEMLGLELPIGIEYSSLDEKFDKSLETPAPNMTPNTPNEPMDDEEKEIEDTEAKPDKETEEKSIVMDANATKELHDWYDMAKRFYKNNKALPLDFECKYLPGSVAARVRVALSDAKSELDIVKAFEIKAGGVSSSDVKELADAINKAVDNAKELYK